MTTKLGFDTGYDEVLAAEVGECLHRHYPGYLWLVEIQDHNVIIRNGESIQNGWCMFLNRKNIPVGSPEKLRKMVMMLGGEMLERAKVHIGGRKAGDNWNILEGTEQKKMLIRPEYRTLYTGEK